MKNYNIDNEDSARLALEEWRTIPVLSQHKQICLAIQSLELSQMYYEQKENVQGIERVHRCIEIMKQRLNELGKVS